MVEVLIGFCLVVVPMALLFGLFAACDWNDERRKRQIQAEQRARRVADVVMSSSIEDLVKMAEQGKFPFEGQSK